MRRWALFALLWAGLAQAQPAEPLGWLRRIHDATEKLSYSGTFVYQQGGRSESSRITRYAPGDVERLEVLDGAAREVVRTRDTVRCYIPGSRVVKIDRRRTDRSFPAMLPEKITALAQHYDIRMGETRRIAGYDCQGIVLMPRDELRYGHRLYADAKSGMLLRAVTFDAAGETVERFSFTQLTIGRVTPAMVKPSHATDAWSLEDADAAPARLAGWSLSRELPGFHRVIVLRRQMGKSKPVAQIVYSDGLAAVSIFIEPLQAAPGAAQTGLAGMGAIHMFTREVANHRVTVVGETPAASVQHFANAVEYRPQ